MFEVWCVEGVICLCIPAGRIKTGKPVRKENNFRACLVGFMEQNLNWLGEEDAGTVFLCVVPLKALHQPRQRGMRKDLSFGFGGDGMRYCRSSRDPLYVQFYVTEREKSGICFQV